MFITNLKTALRTLIRQKSFTLISLFSLTLGLAASLLISLFVLRDLQWDSFQINKDRLFRLSSVELTGNATERHSGYSSPAWGPAMAEQIPEIELQTRAIPFNSMKAVINNEDKTLNNILAVDSTFLDMFSYPLVYGDREGVLAKPGSVVISESEAQRLFGDENPVGKNLILGEEGIEGEITGVFHQPQEGSHLKFNALVTMAVCEKMGFPMDNWYTSFLVTYFMLQPGVERSDELNGKLIAVLDQNAESHHQASFYLQSLKDIHLHSGHIPLQMNRGQSSATMLASFSAIAGLILLLACINAINLATTRSLKRAKEVGLRKTIGARRGQLIIQFMSESFILTLVSILLAIVLVEFAAPWISTIVGKKLILAWNNPTILMVLGLLLILVTLFSGLYPSFVLSSFRPVTALQSSAAGRGKGKWIRRSLVCSQFVISSVLVLVLLMVHAQITYVKNMDLGFASDEIITIWGEDAIWDNADLLKSGLMANPAVKNVSFSWNAPGHGSRTFNVGEYGSEREWMMEVIPIDAEGINTFDWEVKEGRFISDEHPGDVAWDTNEGGSLLLNETAVSDLGWEDPIGKELHILGRKGTVIGVLKNFHMESAHEPIKPVVVFNMPNFKNCFVLVRADANEMESVVKTLVTTWEDITGNPAPKYSFLDETFSQLYEDDENTAIILNMFTGLALFIALIGLIGMAMHSTVIRMKEVSIRKVLGASTSSILRLLTSEFTILVLIANLIASPFAWLVMQKWLSSYSYHLEIPVWLFPVTALITLGIALGTTTLLALKTVRTNPAKVLHHE